MKKDDFLSNYCSPYWITGYLSGVLQCTVQEIKHSVSPPKVFIHKGKSQSLELMDIIYWNKLLLSVMFFISILEVSDVWLVQQKNCFSILTLRAIMLYTAALIIFRIMFALQGAVFNYFCLFVSYLKLQYVFVQAYIVCRWLCTFYRLWLCWCCSNNIRIHLASGPSLQLTKKR